MITISRGNSKIGKMANVSLAPIKSCGEAGKLCGKDCYARHAYRMYPRTQEAWDHNYEQALKNLDGFFNELVKRLSRYRKEFFRWHVAGDIPNLPYFCMMVDIARKFPKIKFLAFTKQHSLVNSGIRQLAFEQRTREASVLPENLQLVFSAWPGLAVDNPHNFPVAWMQDGSETRVPQDALLCAGSCETCNLCWYLSSIKRDVVFHKH